MRKLEELHINPDGYIKQKKDIIKIMFDELKLKETIFNCKDGDTIQTEGFKIDGRKILCRAEKYLIKDSVENYHLCNVIENNMYLWLYNKLKDRFDVSLDISTITDATKAKAKGSWKIDESKCTYYIAINHINISNAGKREVEGILTDGYGFDWDKHIKHINKDKLEGNTKSNIGFDFSTQEWGY